MTELSERDALREELGVEPPKSIEHINILVYGKPGVGKTHLIGTAMEHEDFRPMLVLDADGGSLTLNPWKKYGDVDCPQIRTLADINKWHKSLVEKNDVLGYKAVALDSFSEFQALDLREIMKVTHAANPKQEEEVPSPREYLISGDHMRRVVRAFKDLPMHVIFTAHIQDGEEELGAKTYLPSFTGGKTRTAMPGFLDIVGFLRANEVDGVITRVLQVQATGRVTAKDRTQALPPSIINPRIPDMWELIKKTQAEREKQT